MNDALEMRIMNAVQEIEYHLKQLPVMPNPAIQRYTFPKLEISDVTKISEEKTMAKITAHIGKAEMIYWRTETVNGKEEPTTWHTHDSIDSYWDLGVRFQVIRPDISNTEKAIILLQFRQNMIDNYQETHPETVGAITGAVDELYEHLLAARSNEKETDSYSNMDSMDIKDPKIKDAKKIKIINLLKGIALDEKNSAKIKQHEQEGKFSKKEELVIPIYRQIVYE